MVNISAKTRSIFGRKLKTLRKKGVLPGVAYGPELKSAAIELDLKEFEKVYKAVGESSLISLNLDDKNQKTLVLIREVEIDPLTEKPIHVDFYQPRLKEKVTVTIPLVFKGEAPAVKELDGTLVKNISELEIKALPQNLLHEVEVNVERLKTFEDDILVKDLNIPSDVEILKDLKEVVVFVAPPEKVEEELEKPIEEKVEEVGEAKKEKKEKEGEGGKENGGEKKEGKRGKKS